MFKDHIKALRIKNHYTQEDLANKLNISRQSISKWENGLSYPTRSLLHRMCEVFDVNIGDLLNQDEMMLISIDNNANVKTIKQRNLVTSLIVLITLMVLIVVSILFNNRLERLESLDESPVGHPLVGVIFLDQDGYESYDQDDESTLLALIESRDYPFVMFYQDSDRFDTNKLFDGVHFLASNSHQIEATIYVKQEPFPQFIHYAHIHYDVLNDMLFLIPRETYLGMTPESSQRMSLEVPSNDRVPYDLNWSFTLLVINELKQVDIYQYSESFSFITSHEIIMDQQLSLDSETLYFIIRETFETIDNQPYIIKTKVHVNDFQRRYLYQFRIFEESVFATRRVFIIDTMI